MNRRAEPVRLGVVGLGVIGQAVVSAADRGAIPVTVPAVTTRTPANVTAFLRALNFPPRMTDLEGVAVSCNMVLEASGGDSVESICRACLPRGVDVIVNSVGALLEREDLIRLAEEGEARIFVPSGAIIGLDGLKGAAAGRLDSVTMTTRKPPRGLQGAPYVVEKGIDLDAITKPTLIFEGTPLDACKGFPANVNVSAAVSLVGLGPYKTRMRIICDPALDRNVHEVEAVGEFGRSFIRIENVPSSNPRTGILTYLSTIAFLRDRVAGLVIGT